MAAPAKRAARKARATTKSSRASNRSATIAKDASGELRVCDLIRAIFPSGSPTREHSFWLRHVGDPPKQETKKKPKPAGSEWDAAPYHPADVFAAAAVLLARSGAYHHIAPTAEGERAGIHHSPRRLLVSEEWRNNWRALAKEWTDDDGQVSPPSTIQQRWTGLVGCTTPIYKAFEWEDVPPDWWLDALTLLAVADEACAGIGFTSRKNWIVNTVELALREEIADSQTPTHTISAASADFLCVMPKSRTPRVGCTFRSLTNNLALLPPRGLARAGWFPTARPSPSSTAAKKDRPFNVLLVPFPYSVTASAFKPSAIFTPDASDMSHRSWGWFEVEPEWCPRGGHKDAKARDVGIFVESLIAKASKDVGQIHAVVLPELALSWDAFTSVKARVQAASDVELLVSGVYENSWRRKGNYVATALISRDSDNSVMRSAVDVREKHHRWRLDPAQIESYALGASLDPKITWWEKLDIISRSLSVFVLRNQATVTALICEDLARVDPAQELLRAIGPNLVIALLMDGPQLTDRWSARYGTVLSEDPGSSVLTLTSYALIDRANVTGRYSKSDCVGLWRDEKGGVRELKLPPDAAALCVSLWPLNLTERTLDGRDDQNAALAWTLAGITAVKGDRI